MQELEAVSHGALLSLGADGRTAALLERLRSLGVQTVRGQDACVEAGSTEALCALIRAAQTILLPTPAFREDAYVFGMPHPLTMQELFASMSPGARLLGGRLTAQAKAMAACAGVRVIDYMTLEEVQLRNAIPSAEGAISLCMQQLDGTIDGTRVLIIGYGRIGRVLAQRLRAWGAEVYVAARKEIDQVRIRCDGFEPIRLVEGGSWEIPGEYDVIFNTVPAHVIGEAALRGIREETLLIELASSPGGWSPTDAAALHKRVCYAPGLPAKYAPRTAGYLIAESIAPYLLDGEVRWE